MIRETFLVSTVEYKANFPESANVYDSLGEAFATSGETEKAIESYMKALEVDPQTHSAIEALKQLEGEPQK